MTDPTGRSFLSYRRTRSTEAALIAHALHEHGIPTWQDIHNLGSVPSEDELRRVLADPEIANAVLFITPEVEDSQRGNARAGPVCPFASAGQWPIARRVSLS